MNNAIALAMPPQGFIDHLRCKTAANDHSGARWTVANWIVEQLREQGGTFADADYRRAMSFSCVFEAIATIHAELGYLPEELVSLRYRRTKEMLAFVRKVNPEVAEAIRSVL